MTKRTKYAANSEREGKTMKRLFLILALGIWMVPAAAAQEGGGVSTAIEKRTERIEAFKENHPGAAGEGIVEKYDEYYDKGKFDTLAGDDGLLTEEDWANNRTQREAQAFGDERWDRAVQFDADGDGALDLDEAKAYKQAEKRKLIEHKGELPYLYKDHQWLEEHPEVAKKLIANRQWLKEHPGVAQEVYGNREWLSQHPGVAKEVFKNREFLENHPDVAKKLYEKREWLNQHPEVAEEAYKHRKFLEEHPGINPPGPIGGPGAGHHFKDRVEDVRDHREDVRDRREDRRDRGALPPPERLSPQDVKKAYQEHPGAGKQLYRDAAQHPDAAKKVYRAAEKHPGAAKQLYKDAQKHPDAARKVYRAAERHPDAAKKAYRAADNHPAAAKKAYRAAKQHPGAVKAAVNHPGKARAVAGERRRK